MSLTAKGRFYIAGGTVPRDAACYVEREADHSLFEGLLEGRFCYVLTSRQMGKSSLMVRTAARLREGGASCAILDLTSLGRNLTCEQWYDGLLNLVGKQLHLDDELDEFWLSHIRVAPLQRWMRAIKEVVLQRCDRLVLFIDEIDTVRSLPFSTDEFFAAIRECYNLRTEEPELRRLTFCLLGVATPSDLIRNVRTTPFNIGYRIDLPDFRLSEATPLEEGLRDGDGGRQFLERVIFWTGGHPYLTQRLCEAVAESIRRSDPNAKNLPSRLVDEQCERIYLSSGARERDDNLLFVRDRLLRSNVGVAGLLGLYDRIRHGRHVHDDPMDALIGVLKLSGIVRVERGRLRVRNRIYQHVFDRRWIEANLPDADRRRERLAYRKGALRSVAVIAALLLIVGLVAALVGGERRHSEMSKTAGQASMEARIAQASLEKTFNALRMERDRVLRQTRAAKKARKVADDKAREANRLAKIARDAAQREYRALREGRQNLWNAYHAQAVAGRWSGRAGRRFEGLEALSKAAEIRAEPKLRDEAIACMALVDLHLENRNHPGFAYKNGFRVPPQFDDRLERYTQNDGFGNIVVRRVSDDRELVRLPGSGIQATISKLSPDGRILAAGYYAASDTDASGRRVLRLWDLATRRTLLNLTGVQTHSIGFSNDGKLFALMRYKGPIELYEASTGRKLRSFGGGVWPSRLAFDPTGTRIAVSGTPKVSIYNVVSGLLERELSYQTVIRGIDWNADGTMLAAACSNGHVCLWDMTSASLIADMPGHEAVATEVAFSHDGNLLASTGWDEFIVLWSPFLRRSLLRVKGGLPPAFNADGSLVSGSYYGSGFKLCEVNNAPECRLLQGTGFNERLDFDPSGRWIVSPGGDGVRVWDAVTGRRLMSEKGSLARCVLRDRRGMFWAA